MKCKHCNVETHDHLCDDCGETAFWEASRRENIQLACLVACLVVGMAIVFLVLSYVKN